MTAPEVSLDDVDWDAGDSTLFYYDPKFLFPLEELVSLARAHAHYPGLAHRELRRAMDPEAVARLFGLEGLGGGGGGGSSSAADEAGAREDDAGAGLDKEEPGYVTVEEPATEELADEYVVVGTADEVERERRREADAEAALEAGFSDRVRAIEELLDEADEAEDAVTDTRKKLIDDIDRFLEEAARDPGWNTLYRTIEQHFAFTDDEAGVRTPE